MSAEKLLKVKEAAALMGVCTKTIYRMIGSNYIRFVRIGRSVRVPEEAVAEYRNLFEVPAAFPVA